MSNSTPEPQAARDEGDSTNEHLPNGTLIADRYEVLDHIGTGGMGEVYKVKDRELGTIYALKMIAPALAKKKTLAKRLEHEAQAARTLVHGNIVSVYDVGQTADGAPFLLMDYIEGDSLENLLLKETILTPERALSIFNQIAEALVHAQQKSIIHRDLKPSNILLTKTPAGSDMVKIVDFGIAKIVDQDNIDKTKLTQTGELLGTPLYMSPEQCRGDEIDSRSDIYSLGCIMYEVLSGKAAFAAENPVRVILRHLNEEPAPIQIPTAIGGDLKKVITRCLEKSREDRYTNAVDLHIDLERIINGQPIRPHRAKVKVTQKNKQLAIAGAVCLALIGVGTANYFFIQAAHHVPTDSDAGQHRPSYYAGRSLAQWTTLIERTPDDPVPLFSRGMLHAIRDERTNAVDDFTQAIALRPNYIEAYRQRAFEYAMLAQADKAAQDADKAIALDPQSAGTYETRAMVYAIREQYTKSLADWKRAIAIEPKPYYYYLKSNDELKIAKYSDAKADIEYAINMDKEEPISSYLGISGLLATFATEYPRAFERLEQATSLQEARGVEWQELAYYYVCVGKLDQAEQAIQRAKKLETFPARAYRLAGELYRTAGMYDKAVQEFSASTSLEEYPPGYRERAVTYIKLNQWRSAYADLKKSAQLNPYSVLTASYLDLVENHLGIASDASKRPASASTSTDLPPLVWVNRAELQLNKGDTKAALETVNKALKRDPGLKEAFETRAAIYRKLNKTSEAQADSDHAKTLISRLDY